MCYNGRKITSWFFTSQIGLLIIMTKRMGQAHHRTYIYKYMKAYDKRLIN